MAVEYRIGVPEHEQYVLRDCLGFAFSFTSTSFRKTLLQKARVFPLLTRVYLVSAGAFAIVLKQRDDLPSSVVNLQAC